jgi:tetratricopeptide (TPR) repeat protein
MKHILIFFSLFGLFSCLNNQEKNQEVIVNTWVTQKIIKKELKDNSNLSQQIDWINNKIQSWKIQEAQDELLDMYNKDKKNLSLLNMLWNLYNKKWESKEAIKYLEEANKISEWKDGFILFNLWVSYSNIDKAKAKIYLQKAKEILPDDKNLDNFLKIIQ